MNENMRRAIEALESGVADVRSVPARSLAQARDRLRRAMDDALTHIERDEIEHPEPEDMMGHFDRQARDIAEDLRRADRLMRERTGRE